MNINHFYPEMHTGLTNRPALISETPAQVAAYFKISLGYTLAQKIFSLIINKTKNNFGKIIFYKVTNCL